MVQNLEYYFPSSDGIHQLLVRTWLPAGKAKAILQIFHGVAEHSGRYEAFASFMAENGFVVVAHDHLGHGGSVNSDKELCFFAEEKGWEYVVKDMEQLRLSVVDSYPKLPIFAFGHSMGSFLLRTHLIKYPKAYKAAIISGTGMMPPIIIKAGLLAAKTQVKKYGLQGRSPMLQNLAFGSYNKGFKPARTEFDWLTRDNAIVDEYIADPLCGTHFSVALFRDMMQGLQFIGDKVNIAKMDKDTPMLLLSGDKDPVGGNGKQVKQVHEAFIAAGCKDVGLKLYPEGRHEMLNEINRDEVYAFLLDYLKDKIK